MKFKLIFIILIIIFISGCSKISCNRPYLQVGSSCCLDQNNNKVCDVDEKAGVEQVDVGEAFSPKGCILGDGLSCSGFSVTESNIQMNLKNSLERTIVIHKISFTNINCEATFDETVFKGVKENFVIPCKLTKGSTLDSAFTIDYFEDSKSFSKSGELSSVVG